MLALVEFIATHIREQQESHRYNYCTRHFLQRVLLQKAEDTRKTVEILLRNAVLKPGRIQELYRPALVVLRGDWAVIHSFVKPATDAHSLTTPDPLVRFAIEQIQQVRPAQVVVLLTPELMYFQKAMRDFPEAAVRMFPADIGFIEIPYSQGTSFFSNLNIFHEVGHFIFQLCSQQGDPALAKLARSMTHAVKAQKRLRQLNAQQQAGVREIIECWAQEVFCDLFAVRLIGPAFTFALIDLLWLVGLMKEGNEREFNQLHPSPALRMQQQLRLLKRDGWWRLVRNERIEHIDLIRRLAGIEAHVVRAEHEPRINAALLKAFRSILDDISGAVSALTVPIPTRRDSSDYGAHRSAIEACLANGVVPSAVIDSNLRPGPVAIINAAYVFQLARLSSLTSRIVVSDTNSPLERLTWGRKKVEAWTMKALEDFETLADARRGDIAYGRSVKG